MLSSSRKKLDFSFRSLNDIKSSILSVYAEIRRTFEYACILESSVGADRLAELSIIVFDPSYILSATRGSVKFEDRLENTELKFEQKDPLRAVQALVESSPTASAQFRFVGGAVGYISFDAIRYWENLPAKKQQWGEYSYPDMQFGFYEQGIIFDHVNNRAYYFSSDRIRDRYSEVKELTRKNIGRPSAVPNEQRQKNKANFETSNSFHFSKPYPNIPEEEFESSVLKAKEYIRNGDIFQVVLSKRFDFKFTGDLIRFYSVLRQLNPSPYMYFLDMGETSIAGSSPEMLLRVENGHIETFPIAGTRPRSEDKAQNVKFMEDLLSDPKERAEHLMLVDLARNDVGRVSEFGSVSVPEFMQVHQYSHVQHIVSHVTGDLRNGLTCFDAMRSVFPAGTVSGAPKIRAIQIIDELEPDHRGVYAGAVGYFSFNGNMDSAIAIRTLVAYENQASIQAGAGIVADSDPETEWKETESKAAGLLKALEISAEEHGSFPSSENKAKTIVRLQREKR